VDKQANYKNPRSPLNRLKSPKTHAFWLFFYFFINNFLNCYQYFFINIFFKCC
jgi:hypothetical protein